MRIVWSPVALQRIEEIVDHISSDGPEAAAGWAEKLFDLVGLLQSFPDRGRMVPELGQPSIRELIHGDYRVVFKIEGAKIGILTVCHGKRRFEVSEPRQRRRA